MSLGIVARIRLYDAGNVNWKALRPPYFSCSLRFDRESFDCRIFLETSAEQLGSCRATAVLSDCVSWAAGSWEKAAIPSDLLGT
jgi:hypothetical protein